MKSSGMSSFLKSGKDFSPLVYFYFGSKFNKNKRAGEKSYQKGFGNDIKRVRVTFLMTL